MRLKSTIGVGAVLAAGAILGCAGPREQHGPQWRLHQVSLGGGVPGALAGAVDARAWDGIDPQHRDMIQTMLGRADLERPAVCFAPGTDDATMAAFSAAVFGARPRFNAGARWGVTALDPNVGDYGEPKVLTWSIVPDGTPIDGFIGEPASNSALRARLNAIYPGGQAQWLPIIQGMFDRWSALTGLSYVYEPNDDGVAIASAAGVAGVRGDLRISGHPIDGNSGVLAYNFYPDTGDMVLDTNDSFYTNTASSSIRLRNVLSHEHGHGMGLAHVCPIRTTKLLEPYYTGVFDGPQHDDIRGAHAIYGDAFETNDTPAQATNLGTLASSAINVGDVPAPGVANGSIVSLHSASDNDWYRVHLDAAGRLGASLTPVGLVYEDAQQACSGSTASCCSGTFTDSASQLDLAFQVLSSNGVTVLATSNTQGIGLGETLAGLVVGAGDVFVRVYAAGGTGETQLYHLTLSKSNCPADIDDGSGLGVPDGGVDINDLLFFLAKYEAADLAADLDDGSGTGVPDGGVDINDLLYFLGHYESGC